MPKKSRRNNLRLYKDFLTEWHEECSLGMSTNFVVDTWAAGTWEELFKVLGKYGFSTGDVYDSTVDLYRGTDYKLSSVVGRNLKVYGNYLKQEDGMF